MAWQFSFVPYGITGKGAPLMTTTQLVLSNLRGGSPSATRVFPLLDTNALFDFFSFQQVLEIPTPYAEATGLLSIRYSPLHLRALSSEEVWIWDRYKLLKVLLLFPLFLSKLKPL